MSAVSAKCSRASAVRTVSGSLSGKRTGLRESFTRSPLARLIHLALKASPDYFWAFPAPKRHARTMASSKLRNLGEVELVYFHSRNHHVKGLFPASPHRPSHRLHVVQQFNQALIEAEVADAVLHLSTFHLKRSVTGHAGENFFIRIYF